MEQKQDQQECYELKDIKKPDKQPENKTIEQPILTNQIQNSNQNHKKQNKEYEHMKQNFQQMGNLKYNPLLSCQQDYLQYFQDLDLEYPINSQENQQSQFAIIFQHQIEEKVISRSSSQITPSNNNSTLQEQEKQKPKKSFLGFEKKKDKNHKQSEKSQIQQLQKQQQQQEAPLKIYRITPQKLVQIVTSDKLQYSESFDILLYGYHLFFDSKQLLLEILKRFRATPPSDLNEEEKLKYEQTIIKTIKIRVLIFLQCWFNIYKQSSFFNENQTKSQKQKQQENNTQQQKQQNQNIEDMFVECLYMIYLSSNQEKWVNVSLYKLLVGLENIYYLKQELQFQKQQEISRFYPTSAFQDIIWPFKIFLKQYKKEFAQQLCLYDQEMLKLVDMKELIHSIDQKRKQNNTVLNQITDTFNRISYFIIFSLNKSKPTEQEIIEYFHIFVDIGYDLMANHNNFNSSYSIYLGLKHVIAFSSYESQDHFLKQLQWNQKKMYEQMDQVFNSQTDILHKQNQSVFPCVPFLRVYVKEMIYIHEIENMSQNSTLNMNTIQNIELLNYGKLQRLTEILKKIDGFKGHEYQYIKNTKIYDFIKFIPDLSKIQ